MTYEAPPTISPRYRLEQIVGEGGFGAVWRAVDTKTGGRVAVKLLHRATPESRRRFDVEVRALRRIQHPNCLRPIDAGVSPSGIPFLVMEFVEGQTLHEWLNVPRTLAERIRVAVQVADALASAHREGVVHRDLKPVNVLIRPDGHAVVVDFGIAKLAGQVLPDITKTGEVLGTPRYMSPEQLRGERHVGSASDMYAFGALLFEMLSGQFPFVGNSPLEIAMQHLLEPAPPLGPQLPPHLGALVADLLAKEPAQRPTAAVTVGRLRREARNDAQAEVGKRRMWVPLGAAVGVGILVAAWQATRSSDPPPAPARPRIVDSSPLLNTVDPPPEAQVPEAQDSAEDQGSPGPCATMTDFEPGVHEVATTGDVAVRIPRGYDRVREYPAVVVFPDAYQTGLMAAQLIDDNVPDRAENYVVIAVTGDYMAGTNFWASDEENRTAREQIRDARADLCLDEQTFLLGLGHGGLAASILACDEPSVGAIAVAMYRVSGPDLCAVAAPIPLLSISPQDDPMRPVEGGENCMGNLQMSLDTHHGRLRHLVQCPRKRPVVATVQSPGGTCRDLACPETFRACEISGGRRWPVGRSHVEGAELLLHALKNCPDGPRPTFDVGGALFEFFDEQRAKR